MDSFPQSNRERAISIDGKMMRYGSARTVGSKTHLWLPWMKKIHEPKLYAQNNQSPAFVTYALVQSRSSGSFYVCYPILDLVGPIGSLPRETELECLLLKGRNDAWFKMGLDHIGDIGFIHVRVFTHAISEWRDPSFRGMVWPSANGRHPVLWTSSR